MATKIILPASITNRDVFVSQSRILYSEIDTELLTIENTNSGDWLSFRLDPPKPLPVATFRRNIGLVEWDDNLE